MTSINSPAEVHNPSDVGPALQVAVNSIGLGFGGTINASSNINSRLVFTNGYKLLSFGISSTQGGAVSIQRYLDQAGLIAQGAAVTGTLTANTALIVSSTDGLPFQALKINVTNTGGSTATLSNVLLLLQSY